MRDSLNLSELRQFNAAVQERSEQVKKINRYAGWGVTGVLVVLLISSGPFLSLLIDWTDQFAPQLSVSGIALFIALDISITAAIRGFLSYPEFRDLKRRTAAYAPPYVARLSWLDYLRQFWVYGWILLAIALAAWQPALWPVWIVVALLPYLRVILHNRLIFPWLIRGGLPRVDSLLRMFPANVRLLDIKGLHLIRAGRTSEAVDLYRNLLTRKNLPSLVAPAMWLNNYGVALLSAERFDEALAPLEASSRILPGLANPYDSLAAWYLEQGIEPERALELTEMAVEFAEPDAINNQGVIKATSARALALTGRDIRAEPLLEQALETAEKADAPTAAEIHRQAGYVRLAQGDHDAARTHFERAMSLDPDGLAGSLARRALESITVSTG